MENGANARAEAFFLLTLFSSLSAVMEARPSVSAEISPLILRKKATQQIYIYIFLTFSSYFLLGQKCRLFTVTDFQMRGKF